MESIRKLLKLGILFLILLAMAWQFGIGDLSDEEIEAEIRKDAQSGDIEAMDELAFGLNYGYGMPKDRLEAIVWYRKAAERGHSEAPLSLASALLWKMDVKDADYIEAYAWASVYISNGNDIEDSFIDKIKTNFTTEQLLEAQALAKRYTNDYSE